MALRFTNQPGTKLKDMMPFYTAHLFNLGAFWTDFWCRPLLLICRSYPGTALSDGFPNFGRACTRVLQTLGQVSFPLHVEFMPQLFPMEGMTTPASADAFRRYGPRQEMVRPSMISQRAG
uniref:Uncharacterized protein n=1 Tax=Eutreptiella gymnastica TaxID=73025 RepID=A0A7S4CAX4_9EUGL